jgi:hypothetical protein
MIAMLPALTLAGATTDAAIKFSAGLAAQYPGDEGLEKDPRVLFVEDFETGNIKDLGERWGNATGAQKMGFSDDIPPGSPGRRSLQMRETGHLFTHTRGVDRMHARFYVKFHPKTGYIHHFVTLWADRVPAVWPKGWAGKKPAGDALFSTGIEPWHDWHKHPPPGVWHFYSYWQDMKPDGAGRYWGNFFDAPQGRIEPGRWYCVEAMLKANSAPDAADGEQTFWVDGKRIGHFQGIRWRATDKLKLNSFWLLYYVSEAVAKESNEKYPGRVYEVWFDDIVVATEYIGPVQGRPKGGKKVATPSRSALGKGGMLPEPGKVVFSEKFGEGQGSFRGGEARDGALACPPKGVDCWRTFSVPVKESTSVRFRLKPLVDVGQVSVLIWSDKLKDNARYHITGLKPGDWNAVEFRAMEARTGWAADGASLEGAELNNIKIMFEGPVDARVLIDDFEIRE